MALSGCSVVWEDEGSEGFGVDGVLLGDRYGLVESLGAAGLDSESESESASHAIVSSSAVAAPRRCQSDAK